MSKHIKKKFPTISASIRDRETYSREVIRKAIRESSGMDRSYAWNDKRSYGWETRHRLLTYALIRGSTYSVCERACTETPSISAISRYAEEYGYDISTDTAKAWLEGKVIEKPVLLPPAPPPEVKTEPAKKDGFLTRILRVLP